LLDRLDTAGALATFRRLPFARAVGDRGYARRRRAEVSSAVARESLGQMRQDLDTIV
jgi:hypothetical protein